MCEVSREYKYNRQAFDYKAREMTQKYAVKVNAGDGSSTSLQIQETPNAGEVKVLSYVSFYKSFKLLKSITLPPQSQKKDLCGEQLTHEVSAACKENKKPHSIGKKLSLGLKKPLVNAASLNNNLACSGVRSSAAKSVNNRLSGKLSLRPLGESQLNEVSKAEVLAQTEMNENKIRKVGVKSLRSRS
ncbi:unnamed protein product [Brassica oleracea]